MIQTRTVLDRYSYVCLSQQSRVASTVPKMFVLAEDML